MTKKTILIADIVCGESQHRVKMSADAVKKYGEQMKAREEYEVELAKKKEARKQHPEKDIPLPEEVDKLPPIVVFTSEGDEGSIVYHLGAGYHRIEAARKQGIEKLLCDVREGGADEAFIYAASDNLKHGVEWTTKDKINAIKRMVARFPRKTNRWIAERCGCSHTFVGRVKRGEHDQVPEEVDVHEKFLKACKGLQSKFNKLVEEPTFDDTDGRIAEARRYIRDLQVQLAGSSRGESEETEAEPEEPMTRPRVISGFGRGSIRTTKLENGKWKMTDRKSGDEIGTFDTEEAARDAMDAVFEKRRSPKRKGPLKSPIQIYQAETGKWFLTDTTTDSDLGGPFRNKSAAVTAMKEERKREREAKETTVEAK